MEETAQAAAECTNTTLPPPQDFPGPDNNKTMRIGWTVTAVTRLAGFWHSSSTRHPVPLATAH